MPGAVVVAFIVVAFVAGAVAGAILLVSLASVREDRAALSRRAPDRIALAGRLVTGLRVESPGMRSAAPGQPESRRTRVPPGAAEAAPRAGPPD